MWSVRFKHLEIWKKSIEYIEMLEQIDVLKYLDMSTFECIRGKYEVKLWLRIQIAKLRIHIALLYSYKKMVLTFWNLK